MTEQSKFDLVFLGAGPGGYVAAIRASQLGLSVAVIEKEYVGGTCLNKGCIPSKSLLRSAEIYRNTREGEKFGVFTDKISLEFSVVQKRKNSVVEQLRKGIELLFKKNNITLISGYGQIIGSDSEGNRIINIKKTNNQSEEVIANNVVIATGSIPKLLKGIEADGEYIMTSDDALEMNELPKSIIIIGGGVIGMEWASLLSDFGVEVTIVEFMPRILPLEDNEISKEMLRIMKKKKVKIHTDTKVLADTIKIINDKVELDSSKGEKTIHLTADKVLLSVGREAVIDNLGLETTQVMTEKGFIVVNDFYQTNEPNIYAIGDCIGGLQLAHVASHEGIIAVEHIAGNEVKKLDYSTVPKCTFTNPEIASVGLSEEEAKERGDNVKIGKFQFRGIGKSLVYGETDGFVKLVVDKNTNNLLGAHMIGPHVTDMITEAGLNKVLEGSSVDIAHTIHPHPTLSEAIMEAALDVDDKAIHS